MYEAHSRLNSDLKDYVFESKGHPEPMEEVKKLFLFNKIQSAPLNWIILGQTITDPNNQMITITKYISYTKYATERHLELVQSVSV
jgi:hypothetical protein